MLGTVIGSQQATIFQRPRRPVIPQVEPLSRHGVCVGTVDSAWLHDDRLSDAMSEDNRICLMQEGDCTHDHEEHGADPNQRDHVGHSTQVPPTHQDHGVFVQ
jgi:hypothetical protein